MRHPKRARRGRLLALLIVAIPVIVPSSAGTSAPPRAFTVAAAGDVLIHRRVAQAAHLGGGAYDFAPMFSSIEPWISQADLAICHLEVTLSPDNTGLAYYPRFVAPHEVASAIRGAGYDTCSTAGNHALDGGWVGVQSTLELLDRAGVRHDGTARTPEERLPGLYAVEGVTVAHISYTYGTNGLPMPSGHPYAVNVIDADAILGDAAWARQHGAEFVIVSLHWGIENVVGPTGSQASLADRLLSSPDIDLILGAHAHVVQPIGHVNGKYVVYGMGNQLSNQNGASGPEYYSTEDGLLVLIRVSEGEPGELSVERVDVVPTWVRRSDYRIFSVRDALASGVTPIWSLEASLQRTTARARSLEAPSIRLAPIPAPATPCRCRYLPGESSTWLVPLVE